MGPFQGYQQRVNAWDRDYKVALALAKILKNNLTEPVKAKLEFFIRGLAFAHKIIAKGSAVACLRPAQACRLI